MYRVFIDEVGHHDLKSSANPNHQYLGLTGVIMQLAYESSQFAAALDAIKAAIFGSPNIVLHRREMIDANPPFHMLKNSATRDHLDALLLQLLSGATYRVFTVVIDKREHLKRYVVWRFHPYHYCLTVLLERYVQFLARLGMTGDVLAESRGKKENMQLERKRSARGISLVRESRRLPSMSCLTICSKTTRRTADSISGPNALGIRI